MNNNLPEEVICYQSLIDTMFTMLYNADFSNGNTSDGGVDEGQVRASELIHKLEKVYERIKEKYE